MKCCVCRKEIQGRPHEAPDGVCICAEGPCFHKWKQHTKLGELTGNFIDKIVKALEAHYNTDFPPPPKYLDHREQCRAYYQWIQRYEQKIVMSYVS